MNRYRTGRLAEGLCVWWLRAKGYAILARRHSGVRGSGVGEIDIVARRGDTLCIVEVKSRAGFEQAAEAVSARQRERLTRAAAAFLRRQPALAGLSIRFDAMLVAPGKWPRHLRNAWRDES